MMQLVFATTGDMTIDVQGAKLGKVLRSPNQSLLERYEQNSSSISLRIKDHNTSANGAIELIPAGPGGTGHITVKTCSHSFGWWGRTNVYIYNGDGSVAAKRENIDSGTNYGGGDICGSTTFSFQLRGRMQSNADSIEHMEEKGMDIPASALAREVHE